MGTRCSTVGQSLHSRNSFCRGVGFERVRSMSGILRGIPSHARLDGGCLSPRFLESDPADLDVSWTK